MSQITNPNQTSASPSPVQDRRRGERRRVVRKAISDNALINDELLRRLIGLIQLGFVVLNGLIGLRFLLKLMAANPGNIFANFLYTITQPFLWIFMNLTRTPTFEGIAIEFFDLIAIAVYGLLGWVIVRVLWLLFARIRSY